MDVGVDTCQVSHSGDGDPCVRRVSQEACGDFSGSKNCVGLPRVGKIEKQQSVSEGRWSTAAGDWNCVRADKAFKPSASPQSGVGGTRLMPKDYSSIGGREDTASSQVRCSSPSDCAGCAGEAGRGSSIQHPEPRKRPTSAGSFIDCQPTQIQPEKAPEAGKASSCRCNSQPEIVPEESTIGRGYSQRRRSLDFRRSKSSRPRLDEGNRQFEAGPDIAGRGCGSSGGGGDKSLSPRRSRSARELRDLKSWSALYTSGDRVVECQSPKKRQDSKVKLESSKVSGKQEGTSEIRCNGLTTKLRRMCGGGNGDINARDRGGWDKHQELLSSPSPPVASGEVSRPRKRLSMEVARAASYSANEPFYEEMRALEDGGKSIGERVIPDEFLAKSSSPRNGVDSWTKKHFEGVLSRIDNARDGKIYLDPELQEADKPSADSRVEANQSGGWERCEEYSSEIAAVRGSAEIRQGAPRPNTAAALIDDGFMRKQAPPSDNHDGTDDVANDRQELDRGYLARNAGATANMSGIEPPKGGRVRDQALGMTNEDALQEEDKKQGGCITDSSVALPEVKGVDSYYVKSRARCEGASRKTLIASDRFASTYVELLRCFIPGPLCIMLLPPLTSKNTA